MFRKTLNSMRDFSFAIIFSLIIGPSAYGDELIKAPMPKWVELTNLIETTEAIEAAADEDYYGRRIYAEIHTNYLGQSPITFKRYAFKVNDSRNSQRTPQISIAYAPKNQTYELHNVIVWRDGEPIDMLQNVRASFMTYTSQEGVAASEGNASVQLFIPNLLEEDVVDVSFSVKGQNSAFRNLAFGTVIEAPYITHMPYFNISPTHLIKRTILIPSNKELYFEYDKNEERHLVENLKKVKKYIWNWDLISNPISSEHRYSQFANFSHFSEFSKWHEMVNWAEELFTLEQPLSNDIMNLAKELTKDTTSNEEKLKALTSYMKTEIRYVNIALDRHGFKPFPPSDVLNKKYGDCKDQAMLLVALLKAVGIDSWPALVVSNDRAIMPESLVTPFAFDHLIVQVMIDGETHWIDPTETTYKGAPIWLDLPKFDKALVLRNGENALTEINQDDAFAEVKMIRDYSLPNGLAGGGGSSKSTIVANGRLADEFRKAIVKFGETRNLSEFLRNEKRNFKSAVSSNEPELLESDEENSIRITEEYNYPEPLIINKRNNAYSVDLSPRAVWQGFNKTYGIEKREKPLKLQFPFKATHNYTFDAKGDFEFEPYEIEIKSDYHHFKHKRYFVENVFHVDFSYQTLKRLVNVEDIADYKDDITKLEGEAKFTLWEYDPDPEYALPDETKSVFSNLYKNTPRRQKANDRLKAHYEEKEKLNLTHLESLSELMKWDDLPKDSRIKIRWYYTGNLNRAMRHEEALDALNYIQTNANSVGSWFHFVRGATLKKLNRPLEAIPEFRQSLAKLESKENRRRYQILNMYTSTLFELFSGKDISSEDITFVKDALSLLKEDLTQEKSILDLLLDMYWQLDDQENIIKTLSRKIEISPNKLDWSQLVRIYQLANENALAEAEILKLKEAGFKLRELFDEDGDPLAFYRPTPIYPRRAAEMGIEGFATTQIDIDKTGAVTACRVLEQSPDNIFGEDSCKTAMRSRFYPVYKDGDAIERIGEKMEFIFEMEKRDSTSVSGTVLVK